MFYRNFFKENNNTPEKLLTWKQTANREEGPNSYVFGDITRGVVAYCFGAEKEEEDGDVSYTHLQNLLRQAIAVYKHRGYIGTITISHTVAYFTESCSVNINKENKIDTYEYTEELKIHDTTGGRIFDTLVSRLEKRADSWDQYINKKDIDPSLTSSAQVGFKAPIINIGWGLSVSLTITTKSLLNWKNSKIEKCNF